MPTLDFLLFFIARRQSAIPSQGEKKKLPTPLTIIAVGSCSDHRQNMQ